MAHEPDVKDAEDAPTVEETTEVPSPEPNKAEDIVDKVLSEEDKPTKETDKPKSEPEPKEVEKPEESEQPEAEETTPQKADKPLAPKSENRFQTLANENRELRRKNEQLIAQTYQPATEEELTDEVNPETGENYNRLEAKFEAYRQQQELEKYNSQVSGAQAEIGNEAYSVMNDFPTFNPDSEQFDEDLATEAAQLLEANLIRDPNVPELDESGQQTGKGIVIGSNVSPYQLYKTLARAQGISTAKGQMKGQRATQQMLANADSAGSAAPPKKPKDPVLDILSSDED